MLTFATLFTYKAVKSARKAYKKYQDTVRPDWMQMYAEPLFGACIAALLFSAIIAHVVFHYG